MLFTYFGVNIQVIASSAVVITEAEFDRNLLYPMQGQEIDLEQYRFGNPIHAGEYFSDVYVNGERKGQTVLQFVHTPENPIAGLCLNHDLWQMLDLKPEAMTGSLQADGCTSIIKVLPQARPRFDVANLRLDIEIPKILIHQRPEGYLEASSWQTGKNMAFVRYDFNHHEEHHQQTPKNHHQFLGLQTGLNLGVWSLRHSGSYHQQKHTQTQYQPHQTYIQRDIDRINGRLLIGDFITRSDMFENFAIRGLSMISDTRMLSDLQSNYAPIIRGIANSHAKVNVRQNGHLIYETTVPTGVFEIDDLPFYNYYAGELHVEIEEESGYRHGFNVPVIQSVHMLRPKQLRYEITAGKFRIQNNPIGDILAQASIQYGLNNTVTGRVGLMVMKNYQSLSTGAVWGTKIGLFEGNINHARLNRSNQTHQSNMLRLAYTKTFEKAGAYLRADWQHYLNKESFGLNHAFFDEMRPLNQQHYKNRYQVSLNQNIGNNGGTLYVSGASLEHYQGAKTHEYQVGYSHQYKKLQYRVGFLQSHNMDTQQKQQQFYLNMSMPLGKENKSLSPHWLTTSHIHKIESGDEHHQVALSGMFGNEQQLNYGVFATHAQDGSQHYGISGSYQSSLATVNASMSKSQENTQFSYGISGAVVAHPYGITLGRELGDTFAIVHAKNAKDLFVIQHI